MYCGLSLSVLIQRYIKKKKCEMSFDFVFSLLNCSYESATHLVQEVQLIQPLQAKKNSHESAGENEQKKKKRGREDEN